MNKYARNFGQESLCHSCDGESANTMVFNPWILSVQ